MSFGNNNKNNKIRNVLFVSLVTNNTRKMERGKKLATLGRDQYIRLFQQEQAPIAGKLMNTHGASAVRVITQKMATDGRKAAKDIYRYEIQYKEVGNYNSKGIAEKLRILW